MTAPDNWEPKEAIKEADTSEGSPVLFITGFINTMSLLRSPVLTSSSAAKRAKRINRHGTGQDGGSP